MKSLNTLKGGMVITDDDAIARGVEEQVAAAPGEGRAALLVSLAIACAIRAGTRPLPFTLAGYPALRAVQGLDPQWILPPDEDAPRRARVRPPAPRGGARPDGEAAQARCGAAGLDDLAGATRRRAENGGRLAAALSRVAGVRPQAPTEGAASVWSQFVMHADGRDALGRRLLDDGIDTTMGYLEACHRLPGTGLEGAPFPHSDALARDNLYLPISHEMSGDDVDRVAASVRRAAEARA